jgi:tellurite methyltransferase
MKPDKNFFDKRYSEKDYKFTFRYDKQILSQILALRLKGKFLDLGCGEGGLALELARKGFDVTCIDISKKAISKIKTKAKNEKIKINALAEDIEDYRIQDNYDIILALGIIHFLGEKSGNYIKSIQEHTKNQGINIIDTFINKWLPQNKLKQLYQNWKIIEYEEYKQKLISGNKKWMNLIVCEKIKN